MMSLPAVPEVYYAIQNKANEVDAQEDCCDRNIRNWRGRRSQITDQRCLHGCYGSRKDLELDMRQSHHPYMEKSMQREK